MLLSSIDIDIQQKGLMIGQRQIMLNFVGSNTILEHEKIPQEGKEFNEEEVLNELNVLAKKKCEWIALTGGEPLLQVDYFKSIIKDFPLPIYLETNGTLPDRLQEIKDHCYSFAFLFVPDQQKEFTKSLIALKDSDLFVRFLVDKHTTPKEVEDLAKIIESVNENIKLVLEPIHGVSNSLSLQAMALRHLKDVRVIPKMFL